MTTYASTSPLGTIEPKEMSYEERLQVKNRELKDENKKLKDENKKLKDENKKLKDENERLRYPPLMHNPDTALTKRIEILEAQVKHLMEK